MFQLPIEEGSSRPKATGSEMLEAIKAGKKIGAETLVDHNTRLSLSFGDMQRYTRNENKMMGKSLWEIEPRKMNAPTGI